MSRCPVPGPKFAATKALSLQASSTSTQTWRRPSTPGFAFRARWHSAANSSSVMTCSLPSLIRIAAIALEAEAEMIAQRLDRIAFARIGIGIGRADDDDAAAA